MQRIEEVAIIPKPYVLNVLKDEFILRKSVSVKTDQALFSVSRDFVKYLKEKAGISTQPDTTNNSIAFVLNKNIEHEEGYHLAVKPREIQIEAKTEKGAFYAVQTLKQLFPATLKKNKAIAIPCVDIKDEPQFSYRGMHLDVGRHFYPVDFIKKYIDLIAQLKFNTFHWHLTEDQGWRIEIKKYPKLQDIAAFRKETLIGHYSDQPHQFDGKPYGGYYTQEEIKDIVSYAKARQINIIPEIEMPGHSQAAIAAYPKLGCSGEEVEVATKWGVFEEVYCPTEYTFDFLEDVIDEVVSLFPGKYIHIGGDEAPKTRWKHCKHCQKLIREKGLKDEHGLQSYFIRRMEKYINSKGKQIIGWDEILEGGLAPNATVMSWRGTQGAVQAAKEGHPVILTPTSHCYFDYYQSENDSEPLAIGGFLPLEKVYSFHPIPKELMGTSESRYVLGGQGNVWTEYMPTSKQVEYMAFPRAAALAEALWSEEKEYKGFLVRLESMQRHWDEAEVNYANHLNEIHGELINSEKKLYYELSTVSNAAHIYYSLDRSKPDLRYDHPIPIDSSVTITAEVKTDHYVVNSSLFEQRIELHKAVGSTISIDKAPHPSYAANGEKSIINGISGSDKRFGDKEWLGFWGEDLEITIEFDQPLEINTISTRFHNGNGQWIYAPKEWEVSFDNDSVATIQEINSEELISSVVLKLSKNRSVKKVHITIPNYGKIPQGKQGAGNKAWTFIDEIMIR